MATNQFPNLKILVQIVVRQGQQRGTTVSFYSHLWKQVGSFVLCFCGCNSAIMNTWAEKLWSIMQFYLESVSFAKPACFSVEVIPNMVPIE